MRTAFIGSFIVFTISVIFLIITVPINCGLANPIFDSTQDSIPYIEQMRAIINVFDVYDKLDSLVMIISAISSGITGFLARKSGEI